MRILAIILHTGNLVIKVTNHCIRPNHRQCQRYPHLAPLILLQADPKDKDRAIFTNPAQLTLVASTCRRFFHQPSIALGDHKSDFSCVCSVLVLQSCLR